MIVTLTTKDVYDVINNLGLGISLYSTEPKSEVGTYGRISIISNDTGTNTHSGYMTKVARVSITIVSAHQDNLTTNEENHLDTLLDTLTNSLVDEGKSKIVSRGDKEALYCIDGGTTPMLYTLGNRAYKIKDFLIAYTG